MDLSKFRLAELQFLAIKVDQRIHSNSCATESMELPSTNNAKNSENEEEKNAVKTTSSVGFGPERTV